VGAVGIIGILAGAWGVVAGVRFNFVLVMISLLYKVFFHYMLDC